MSDPLHQTTPDFPVPEVRDSQVPHTTIRFRYFRKAQRLLGEPISTVAASFSEDWTGELIGGGVATATMAYDPVTRGLLITSSRPPVGEMGGDIEIVIGG